MFQPEGVTDFVDDFFSDAIREHFRLRLSRDTAVGGRLETVRRDNATGATEIRESKS